MALSIESISLVQGTRDFHLEAVQLVLTGPTPNDTLPLVDPEAGGSALYPFAGKPTNWRGDD